MASILCHSPSFSSIACCKMSLAVSIPRTRAAYAVSRNFRCLRSSEKLRMSVSTVMIWLLAPFVLVTLWTAYLRVQIENGEKVPQVPQTTVTERRAPRLNAVGKEFEDNAEVPLLEKYNSFIDRDSARGQAGDIAGAGHISLLSGTGEVEVDNQHTFIPEDINNPTKVAVPKNGFPPLRLPREHRNAELLESIRGLCQLSPRWPKHPGMHAIELRSYGPAYSSIIISHKLKVIYVPVFKVGTTSMMWNIAYLENNSHILDNVRLNPAKRDYFLHHMGGQAWQNHTIYTKSLEEIRAYFEDPEYLKFGFVRNPFDRIISAYLDKVVGYETDHLDYQSHMYSLYGEDDEMRRFRNETKPTFREYLEAIEVVLAQPRTRSNDLWNKKAYEDNTSRRDIHWRPQVELLHPDLVHFDFVGRFENMREGRQVVLDWMYRQTDRRMPQHGSEKLHTTNPTDKVGLHEELRLDQELREMVIRIYQDDFDRFQFSRDLPRDYE